MNDYRISMLVVIPVIILLFGLNCCSKQQPCKNNDWEYYKIHGDSIISKLEEKDKYVFIITNTEEYKNVSGTLNLNEDYRSIINIIDAKDFLVYRESPYSESGDWDNTYTSYYDIKGNLKVLIRESSFFNSVCKDGIITEKEVYSYESNKLIKRSHEFYDENMKFIKDTSNCVFNYRFKYNIYKKFDDIPVVKRFGMLKR